MPRASIEGSPLLGPATACLAVEEHPGREFVERGFVEATLAARWGIRRTLGTYAGGTSGNRGMLEDADLDGLLRLGDRADPPTHQSGGRYTRPPRAEGSTSSWSVPSRLPLVERPGGDTLSACLDLEGT